MRIIDAALAVALLTSACTPVDVPVAPSGYDSELHASGMGSISGITIGPDSRLYAADFEHGRVYGVAADGTVTRIASGVPEANGIAFTAAGRMFVASRSDDAVYEIVDGNPRVFVSLGESAAPTSVAALGDTLYVSNSGQGTVVRVAMNKTIEVELSGFSAPNGPYGLSFDDSGKLYFIDHLTGGVYSYDFELPPRLVALVTARGGTYTATGFDDRLFITDVQIGDLLWLQSSGGTTVFASGFAGNASPPAIGPNGIAYDGNRKLYAASADAIYVFTRQK